MWPPPFFGHGISSILTEQPKTKITVQIAKRLKIIIIFNGNMPEHTGPRGEVRQTEARYLSKLRL